MFARTRIEIADFHTTLSYFNKTPPDASALPLGTPSSYVELYKQVVNELEGLEYLEASGGKAGRVFLQLKPFFSADKFWRRYLETGQVYMYPDIVWEYQVPLKVGLSPRVEYIPDPHFAFKVSPILTVVLFPFGWSTWLSLLITGDHDLISLSSFIQNIFQGAVFKLSENPTAHGLERLFEFIAEGTRSDAFAGPATKERSGLDFYITVTVLAKQRGSLSSGGLSVDEQRALQRIVRPTGLQGSSAFQKQIHELNTESGEPLLNFMCADDFGRFTWYYQRLIGEKRDLRHLECYHNNIFRSFLLAFHQVRLLELALRQRKPLKPELRSLIGNAIYMLKDPAYRNKSLKLLLEREDVQETLASATQRWPEDDAEDDS
jgi:hypothetical protein